MLASRPPVVGTEILSHVTGKYEASDTNACINSDSAAASLLGRRPKNRRKRARTQAIIHAIVAEAYTPPNLGDSISVPFEPYQHHRHIIRKIRMIGFMDHVEPVEKFFQELMWVRLNDGAYAFT